MIKDVIEVVSTTGRLVHQCAGDGREFDILWRTGDPWIYQGVSYHVLKTSLDWSGPAPRMRVLVIEDKPRTIFPLSN